jgi:hypothetical protein
MRAGADKVYVKPNNSKALLSIALDIAGAGCELCRGSRPA